ncbi:alpha/beta hydrolase [Streptomyces turgidiscabies]|uniref:Hydrolase, alpha/beta domain protein n=1 Tax=Streptomyces turgidiscabies (strain Car8) TaxID=698760 RepID=L7F5U9_STRT8|nr:MULTISPECIES: alpha/beta hydrolase [Streptomyces]ELP66963.1 hydrolase, alpha/beta domain protein [Streptomyces turgidiscabies Car8]MDX3492373.1 alpha/beta hydrolase [Streptomyces turgidiscabies]GAQ69332.1 tripeptidyl aminopeptidase precursor [Streptomyces turgidiscabies]
MNGSISPATPAPAEGLPHRLLARTAAGAALCLVGALTVAASPAAAQPVRAAAEDPLARFHHQDLAWKSCLLGPDDATGKELDQAGARCADVTVPLNHDDPGGRTITVAISRIRGTDTAHRVGALLLNGGGPGGQTLGDPPWVRTSMKEVAERYDVVGVDPRFVGRSTPLDCHWPTGSFIRGAGTDRADFDRSAAFAAELARRCRTNEGDVLPYVTTRNTARDMDVIRAALGERRISYLGYSYGSYLGQVYATMFPGRTDRVVLDGVIAPDRYGPRLLRGTERANRHALEGWAAWAAARNTTYGLGGTRSAVLKAVDRVQAAAGRTPLSVGGRRVDANVLPVIVLNGLSQDNDAAYGAFAEAVQDLRRAAAGHPVTPSPWLADALGFLLTGSDSSYGSVQTAILCGDVAAPRDPETYWRDVRRARAKDALIGPLTNNIGPCAFWDAPRERPTTIRADLPALLVNATGDPRTTYEGAKTVRGDWPSSRLVTLRGADQHAVYGVFGSSCVDSTVNAYLATGRLPARDLTCERVSG